MPKSMVRCRRPPTPDVCVGALPRRTLTDLPNCQALAGGFRTCGIAFDRRLRFGFGHCTGLCLAGRLSIVNLPATGARGSPRCRASSQARQRGSPDRHSIRAGFLPQDDCLPARTALQDRYQTEVESWRNLQSANIEYTMKRLREPIESAPADESAAGLEAAL